MLKSHHQLFGDKFASLDTPLSMFRFLSFFFLFKPCGEKLRFSDTPTPVCSGQSLGKSKLLFLCTNFSLWPELVKVCKHCTCEWGGRQPQPVTWEQVWERFLELFHGRVALHVVVGGVEVHTNTSDTHQNGMSQES